MLQVLAIGLENLLVVDEEIANVAHSLLVGCGHGLNPGRGVASLDFRHGDAV